jgi:hypothetical protein
MINKEIKEKAILLAGFGFISKEVQDILKTNNVSLATVLKNKGGEWSDELRAVRLLQKTELMIGKSFKKVENYLNKCIERVGKRGEGEHINIIVGLTMLERYKEEYKFKRFGKGMYYSVLEKIYDSVESKNLDKMDAIINSQNLATKLYKEILK